MNDDLPSFVIYSVGVLLIGAILGFGFGAIAMDAGWFQ